MANRPCLTCGKAAQTGPIIQKQKPLVNIKKKERVPDLVEKTMLGWGVVLSCGDTVTGSVVRKDFNEFRDELPASVEIEELFFNKITGERIFATKDKKEKHIRMNYDIFSKLGKGKKRKELLVLLETEYIDKTLRKVICINT